MTVGFIMLTHTALDRAAEVAKAIAAEGCPVVIHVDRRTDQADFDGLADAVSATPTVSFSRRFRCDWGTWSLVEAARVAAEQLLSSRPDIGHVMLISGACLPIKPIAELKAYLAERPDTDFIESVTVEEVPWTAGGLSDERFSLSFPFPWKRQRGLFDAWVNVQRRLSLRRVLPAGLKPHLGSQWWCLSRATLERILFDNRRAELDRFFRYVWIPDESYFQSLVRLYGTRVESRSLTLSKFDFQGKPHVFYDDHLALLADSPAFFARKIWPGAYRLFETFLGDKQPTVTRSSGMPGAFADRIFGEAVTQRTSGRAGLTMAGRFPREGFETGQTAAAFAVMHGFGDVFEDFSTWAARETGTRAHGNLFGPDRVEFANGEKNWAGALSDNALLRDYNPEAFLRNLIWNTRGEHQSFLLSGEDNLDIGPMLASDRNASVFVVSGAWIVPLMRSGQGMTEIRKEAARLQAREAAFIARLQERRSRATVRIWKLADVLERPTEPLQEILDTLTGAKTQSVQDVPVFRPMAELPEMLQDLRNAGMNPYLAGEVAGLPIPERQDADSNVIRLR
ncbi:MAG: glycosyl transferase [Silicimonas sp.]|nr:glycosyl transferase [Silicimonas sp.]